MTAGQTTELAGLVLLTFLLLGAGALGAVVAWRVRGGPRPWSNWDVGLAFLALLWVSGTVATAGQRLATGSWLPSDDSPVLPALVATAAGGFASAAVVLLRAGRSGAGFGRVPGRWTALAAVLVLPFLVLSASWVILLEKLGFEVDEQQILGLVRESGDPWTVGVSIAYGAVLAPVFEEMLFRGFAIPPLARRVGPSFAIAITALIFGTLHGSDPAAVVPLTLLGVALGWLRVRSGSLWPSIALHVANNMVAIGAAVLAGV